MKTITFCFFSHEVLRQELSLLLFQKKLSIHFILILNGQKKSPACGGAFCTPVKIIQASASLPPHGFCEKEKTKIGKRLVLHVKIVPSMGYWAYYNDIEFFRQFIFFGCVTILAQKKALLAKDPLYPC